MADELIIRKWVVAALIKESAEDYQSFEPGDEPPPADYGSYSLYDGIHGLGGGYTTNLALTYRRKFTERLNAAKMPIFLWRRGKMEEWPEDLRIRQLPGVRS